MANSTSTTGLFCKQTSACGCCWACMLLHGCERMTCRLTVLCRGGAGRTSWGLGSSVAAVCTADRRPQSMASGPCGISPVPAASAPGAVGGAGGGPAAATGGIPQASYSCNCYHIMPWYAEHCCLRLHLPCTV